MSEYTPCPICGNPAIRRGSSGRHPKYCSDTCAYKARYHRDRTVQLALRSVSTCRRCGKSIPGARPDRKYCSGACQSYQNRRDRGVVVENTRCCSACLQPLVGQQSNATVCANRKCQIWALRHPGVLHPSVTPRYCAWCGTSIDHRNGKAKYCSQHCTSSAWADTNRDHVNELKRGYWSDPSSGRKSKQQEYRKANIVKYRQYGQISRANDPERYRAYYTKWLADPANYQLTRVNSHKRRVRERQNPGSVGIQVKDWLRLIRRYRSCCAYCGVYVDRPVVEHIIPVSRGGRHAIGNVLPACEPCNGSKHNKLLAVWRHSARTRITPPISAKAQCRW